MTTAELVGLFVLGQVSGLLLVIAWRLGNWR